MAKLWDNPRPQGYWPGTPTQWREPSVDDCTWYATEFLFEAASETHLSMHPVRDIREHSTDTEGGTTLRVALRDTATIWPDAERVTYKYGLFSRSAIVEALKAGAGILWGGDYERLPLHYRRWTNNDVFAHAAASLDLDIRHGTERTFWYDPLGGGPQREPYDGEWITIDALLNFNWGSGRYSVGIVENLGDEPMRKLHLPVHQEADRVVRLRRGAAARVAPRVTAAVTRRFWNESTQRQLLARFTGGWGLVLWNDGEGHTWDFGYVSPEDMLSNEANPRVFPDAEALKLANEALVLQVTEGQMTIDAALIQATEVVQTLGE